MAIIKVKPLFLKSQGILFQYSLNNKSSKIKKERTEARPFKVL